MTNLGLHTSVAYSTTASMQRARDTTPLHVPHLMIGPHAYRQFLLCSVQMPQGSGKPQLSTVAAPHPSMLAVAVPHLVWDEESRCWSVRHLPILSAMGDAKG